MTIHTLSRVIAQNHLVWDAILVVVPVSVLKHWTSEVIGAHGARFDPRGRINLLSSEGDTKSLAVLVTWKLSVTQLTLLVEHPNHIVIGMSVNAHQAETRMQGGGGRRAYLRYIEPTNF